MTEATASFMTVKINTRWPIRQVGDSAFLVDVPMGGTAMISNAWVKQMGLTDREADMIAAECQELAVRRLLVRD